MVTGILSLLYAGFLLLRLLKRCTANPHLQEISRQIFKSSISFLLKLYKILAIIDAAVFVLICLVINNTAGAAYAVGAVLSAGVGFFSIIASSRAGMRTALDSQVSVNKAFHAAFTGGSAVSILASGLGLLGIGLTYSIFKDIVVALGFGLGISSMALFSRFACGICSKASRASADFTGTDEESMALEEGRTALKGTGNIKNGVIGAAGFGAGIFEAGFISLLPALILGEQIYGEKGVLYALLILGTGILSSLVCSPFIRGSEKTIPQRALRNGIYISNMMVLVASGFLSWNLFDGNLAPFYAAASGLVAGMIIGQVIEIYTSRDYRVTRKIAKQAQYGEHFVILNGLATGMHSILIPVILIAVLGLVSFYLAGGLTNTLSGVYGIALSAAAVLSAIGFTGSSSAYSSILDNAKDMAELTGLPPSTALTLNKLDFVVSGISAASKGLLICSAILSSAAFTFLYVDNTVITSGNLFSPVFFLGLILGGTLPYIFCALAMGGIGQAFIRLSDGVLNNSTNVERQDEETKKSKHKYGADEANASIIKRSALSGILALVLPLLAGIVFGIYTLYGMIIGLTASGLLSALQYWNSGDLWSSAAKHMECEAQAGSGFKTHKQAAVPDFLGGSFKDLSGPVIVLLIKHIVLAALLFEPIIIKYGGLLEKLLK